MTTVLTNPFKLAYIYFRFYFLGTIRNVPALFFTLIFPALIFLLSARVWGSEEAAQRVAYLTFANYSVQTVCFMLLGMGVSQEKTSHWAQYSRTLPTSVYTMVMGRVLHTIVLSLMNVCILTILAMTMFSLRFSFDQLLWVFLVCAFGAIPFALMGITIGYLANKDAARSIFTLLNLLFLFGAFGFTQTGIVYKIQNFILSYQWVTLQKHIFDPSISITTPILSILGYIVVFGVLVSVSFNRSRKI